MYDNAGVDFSFYGGFGPVLILNGDFGSVGILGCGGRGGVGQGGGYELSVLLLRVLSSSSSEESPP